MGLFSGGNSSTAQNTTNSTTSNVTDNRIGVADSATAITAQGGSTITQNISSTTTQQVVDSAAMTALATSVSTVSGDVADMVQNLIDGVNDAQGTVLALGEGAFDTAKDLFDQAQGAMSEALAAAEASANAAIANANANLSSSLGFATGQTRDSLDFAKGVTADLKSSYLDYAARMSAENDDQRAYSSQLVGDVLKQARTSDERNIEQFLTTSKWIVAFVVIAFVAPKVFAK